MVKKKQKTKQNERNDKLSSPPTPRQSWMRFIGVEAVVDLCSAASRLGPHRGSKPAVGGIYHWQGIAEAGIKGGDEPRHPPNVEHVPRLFTSPLQQRENRFN